MTENDPPFDPASFGLETHYSPKQQRAIKRLIQEDLKVANVKLPTYVKQIAQALVPHRVPDEWLKKLSHQTMSKMLTNTSTPRQDFWAALHLYLNQKFGDIGLSSSRADDVHILGRALARFGQTDEGIKSGEFALSDNAAIRLEAKEGFYRFWSVTRRHGKTEFHDDVYEVREGVGLVQKEAFYGMQRAISDRLAESVNLRLELLNYLKDHILAGRLKRLADST